MFKILTKSDICLIVFFIILSIYINFQLVSSFEKIDIDDGMVVVYVNKSVSKKIPINDDGEYTIISGDNKSNTLQITDNVVKMIHATCNDGLCLYQPPIAYGNESIVCLPHQLTITIENVEFGEIDSIVL